MVEVKVASKTTVGNPTNEMISSQERVETQVYIKSLHGIMTSYLPCNILYFLQKFLAASMFLFLLIWIFVHAGGVGWHSEPKLEFNLHPMAMSFGFVFLNGEAITVYRGARNTPKKKTKLIHMVLQLAALTLSILGIIFAFDSHNYENPPIPNLYTLHSWMGILTTSVFVCQWATGFFFLLASLCINGIEEKNHAYSQTFWNSQLCSGSDFCDARL